MDYQKLLAEAVQVAAFGTCNRRQIGCVLVNEHGYTMMGGYNGPPRSLGSCREDEVHCPARDLPAGSGGAQTACYGVHAEVRALRHIGHDAAIHTIVCTKAPCLACTLLLLETSCQVIAFKTGSNETENKTVWEQAGRTWLQL